MVCDAWSSVEKGEIAPHPVVKLDPLRQAGRGTNGFQLFEAWGWWPPQPRQRKVKLVDIRDSVHLYGVLIKAWNNVKL